MFLYSINTFAALAGHSFVGNRRWDPAMSAGVCPGYGALELQSKTNGMDRLEQIT